MKKKTLILALSSFCVLSLASCSKEKIECKVADKNDTALREGFKDLSDEFANKALKDGKYEYAGQSFNVKNIYKTTYSTEPDNWNYLTNQSQWNSAFYCNMVDGLVENNKYGAVVGSLARGYTSELQPDGSQKWTFQLKEGVQWRKLTQKSKKKYVQEAYSEVVAQNFVDAIKYVLNPANGSATAGIVKGQIKGAADYYSSLADKDASNDLSFDTVGVKAIDKYTVEYTTPIACPYFLTCLTYSPYLPVDGNFLAKEGSDFGKSYKNILVNGAFFVENYVIGNSIILQKSKGYYDQEHVYVDKVQYKYLDSQTTTATTARTLFEQGDIDGFTVNKNDEEGYAKYVTGQNGEGSLEDPISDICNPVVAKGDATYMGYFNFDRDTFEYGSNCTSMAKTAAEKAATKKALANKHFRCGVLYGLDITKELEAYPGGINYLTRCYTTANLCSADGKDYVDFVQDIFKEKTGINKSLFGVDDQEDAVYNPAKSAEEFATAKAELLAAGLTEADFPIKLDVLVDTNPVYRAFDSAMYTTLNTNGEGYVICQENFADDSESDYNWRWQSYNYDLQFGNGWGPDYADPQTFLASFAIGGELTENMGFRKETPENEALELQILGDYNAKFEAAAAIVDGTKIAERYEKFAEAEYSLLFEEALCLPFLQANGRVATVSRTVAHQAGTASYGLTGDKLKNVVVTNDAITRAQRTAINEYFEAQKSKAA